jgi:hypothetical protein
MGMVAPVVGDCMISQELEGKRANKGNQKKGTVKRWTVHGLTEKKKVRTRESGEKSTSHKRDNQKIGISGK